MKCIFKHMVVRMQGEHISYTCIMVIMAPLGSSTWCAFHIDSALWISRLDLLRPWSHPSHRIRELQLPKSCLLQTHTHTQTHTPIVFFMWCVYLHGEYISTRAFLARVVVFLFVSRVLNSYEVAVADHHQPYSRVADDSVRDQLVDFLGFTSAFVFLELVYIFRICTPKKCTHAYDVLCMVSG